MIKELAVFEGVADRVVSRPEDLENHGFGSRPLFEALIAEDEQHAGLGFALFYPRFQREWVVQVCCWRIFSFGNPHGVSG
jgi:hypothetical protein